MEQPESIVIPNNPRVIEREWLERGKTIVRLRSEGVPRSDYDEAIQTLHDVTREGQSLRHHMRAILRSFDGGNGSVYESTMILIHASKAFPELWTKGPDATPQPSTTEEISVPDPNAPDEFKEVMGTLDDAISDTEATERAETARREDIWDRFHYHSPSPDGVERHRRLSIAFFELAMLIEEIVPPGREQSLAFTKLEEAKFFASAGVARDPETR